jgi:hypothetical protein
VAGAYGFQRKLIWALIALSIVFGSLSMAILMNLAFAIRSKSVKRKTYIRTGIFLIILGAILPVILYNELKSSILLISFMAFPLMIYAGGGFLLLSVKIAKS